MYLIDIQLKTNDIPKAKRAEMLDQHRAWFQQFAQQGNFLLLGPYLDQTDAGVIIAQAENRQQLEQILADDVYYPHLADYRVREFKANLISNQIQQFQGA